jgi:hypothetical protein
MVYKDPDVSIAAIIESIKAFSNYTVNYGNAWRAKQHAISMLWGVWKDAYGRVPKILQAITHFNPGVKWCTHTTGKEELHKGVTKQVMEWMYWCFP